MEEVIKPFLAKGGNARNGMINLYESPIIDEVHVDGELKEYRCRYGDYSAGSPSAIVGHYGTTGHPKTKQPDEFVTQIPEEEWKRVTAARRKWTHSKDPLYRAVYDAIQAGGQRNKTLSVWAMELTERMREAGVTVGTESDIPPSEANVILEKIRDLVGSGSEKEVEELKNELEKANAQIMKHRQAFSILSELGQGEVT